MDLNSKAIHDIIHPTAAFSLEENEPAILLEEALPGTRTVGESWADSQLNPKNRIDSLDLPEQPLWRIDGCTGLGTQFYSIPLFMSHVPPLRIDVFIPQQPDLPALIRDLLDLDVAFHTKDRTRTNYLAISRHIVRKLQSWTRTLGDPAIWYMSLPFGSRIVFQTLSLHLHEIEVSVAYTSYLERQLLSVPAISSMWGVSLPPTIDIFEIHVVEQLHDSVCLVQIYGELWILKALTSYTKYLYHELKLLLTTVPHSNVVARPAHLITKLCKFGPQTKVIGFTLEYHAHGSLRDLVPFLHMHDILPLSERMKWSVQLTSALLHLRQTSGIFYPDLRLDNVVLSKFSDVVMVDFEQRGVWCEFAAPEVNAIEYVRLLAIDDDIPVDIRDRYSQILEKLLPGYESLLDRESYTNPAGGYNIPWLCLSEAEREASEVYMLGRVLWCIFEGAASPQRAAVWLSYPRESDLEFPNFRHTPEPLRDLIESCTRGRREILSRHIIRDRTRLVLRNPCETDGVDEAACQRQLARDWWLGEINNSVRFLEMRGKMTAEGQWNGNYFDRPKISEVLERLQQIQQDLSLGS
jgi:hypothetical protein